MATFTTREERDAAANAVAELLDSLGFTTMAADCRGKCAHGDGTLDQYARLVLRQLQQRQPKFYRPVLVRFRALGLA